MAINPKSRKVLITSGPTWVSVDKVRVISNTASGRTGIILANEFARKGWRVTLLLGPAETSGLSKKVTLKRFSFFDELVILLKRELSNGYDAIIQAAAVSDFKPVSAPGKKISSRLKKLQLVLKPAPKIINRLRNASPGSFLAGFKFEPDMAAGKLTKEARGLIKEARLDCVVANSLRNKRYNAYIVEDVKSRGPFLSKAGMAKELVKLICQNISS